MALTTKEREKVANAEAIQKAFTEIVNGILRVALVSGPPERSAAARWLQALLNSEDFGFRVGGVEGSGHGAPPDGRVISVVITLVVPRTEERKQTDPPSEAPDAGADDVHPAPGGGKARRVRSARRARTAGSA